MRWPAGDRVRPQELILPAPGERDRVPGPVSAVVVGGGLAGIAAATILAERGVSVTLVEREPVLGGRVGSWGDTLADGEGFEMSRGFHAFFRQYYNLRALLQRIDPALDMLVPLDDYPILGPEGAVESFTGLPRTPPLNVIELTRRTSTMGLTDLMRVNVRAALAMLQFDGARTYQRYDDRTASAYLDSLRFPPAARRMLFDVFSHSFFNPEEDMSAAELLMMFHFYFMGNPEGLIFDVARCPFSALMAPLGGYIEEHGARILYRRTARQVARIPNREDGEGGRWRVLLDQDEALDADLVVLATTVPALQALVDSSPDLDHARWRRAIGDLAVTNAFAVWRLWLDRPTRPDRAPFVGTTGMGTLDNISLFHLFEDQSERWAQRTGGAVVELHAYAVPPDMEERALRADLLGALHALYPETRDATILEERFLLRRDCPAFGPGSHAHRPGVDTPFEGLALAGDFARLPIPSALMERAATAGMLAANHLLARWQVHPEPIRSVPMRGLLALGIAPESGASSSAEPAPPAGAAPDRLWTFGQEPPSLEAPLPLRGPDWRQADPRWIRRALARALALPSGGWYVVDAARQITDSPRCYRINGRALVVWRDGDTPMVAPDACPHMGASLSDGVVRDGKIVCPWHGLALGNRPHGGWRALPAHDDGVLVWVRMPEAVIGATPDVTPDAAIDAPILPQRPATYIDAVVRMEARCEPRDVIANRLDPWHGTHFHPHSFGRLKVIDVDDEAITVRVAYRILGRVAMEVDARFHCPEPRTIVMTIVAGEGAGSVVETHATPTAPGRTAIIEATLATSERIGFGVARMAGARLIRPLMRKAAHRLWVEDAAYAERLYTLRHGEDR